MMTFDAFTTIAFRPRIDAGFVYVFFWTADGVEIPFYVGQTKSIWGRLNDYYWADFKACTDFRVGEAAKYLSADNIRIAVKYKSSAHPLAEERELIHQLRSEGYKLLNDCRAYDYQSAHPDDERVRIRQYVDGIIGQHAEGPKPS
jgi:hypothetical protein